MKNLLLITLTLFFFNLAQAQYSYPTDEVAKEALKRTVVVELLEVDEKKLEQYKKKEKKEPGAADAYLKRIEKGNSEIKAYFEKYWKVNDKVEFKTKTEIDELIKSDNGKYSVFATGWRAETRGSAKVIYEFEVFNFALYLSEKAGKRNRYYIDETGDMSKMRGPYVFKISVPDNTLSEGDYKFVLDQFNYHIKRAAENPNLTPITKKGIWPVKPDEAMVAKFKTKTLLIPKEYLKEGITESILKTLYKHPHKICSLDETETAILENNKDYIYITMSWHEGKSAWIYTFVDAESGADIGYVTVGGITLGVYGASSGSGNSSLVSYRSAIALGKSHFKGLNMFITNKSED